MFKRILFVSLFGLFVLPAIGEVVVHDDFSDQIVDWDIWTASASSVEEIFTSGLADDQWGAGEWDYPANATRIKVTGGYLHSLEAATLSDGGVVTFSADLQLQRWAWGGGFGLTNSQGDNIQVTVDDLGEGNGLYIYMTVGGTRQYYLTGFSDSDVRNGWSIQWAQDRVTVVSSNWGVVFDSNLNAPNSGSSWNIPPVGTSMKASLSSGYLETVWATASSMKLESDSSKVRLLVADDFAGGSAGTIDTTKWITFGNVISYTAQETANGGVWDRAHEWDWNLGETRVLCTNSDGNGAWIKSRDAFTLEPDTKLLLHGADAKLMAWADGGMFGFASDDFSNSIGLENRGGAGVFVSIRTNGVVQEFLTINSPDLVTEGWRVIWADGWVQVVSDAWGVKFDSRVNPPSGSTDPADWNIPAPGTTMHAYLTAGYNTHYWASSDSIIVYEVPLEVASYIDDKFDGDRLNSLYWTKEIDVAGGYADVANGQLHMDTVGRYQRTAVVATEEYAVQPTAEDPVVVVFENNQDYRMFNPAASESCGEFYGILDNMGDHSWGGNGFSFGISTQNINGAGGLKFELVDRAQSFYDFKEIWIDPVWGAQWRTDGTWMIVWETDRITVYHNGELLFDTDVDAGEWNGTQAGAWPIPSEPMRVNYQTYAENLQAEWTVDRIYCGPRSKLYKGAFGSLKSDLDKDYTVSLGDLSKLASNWQDSTDPSVAGANVVDMTDSFFINVPQSSIAPTLDGVKSTGEWDDAVEISFDATNPTFAPGVAGGGKNTTPIEAYTLADLSAKAYLKFTAEKLYVGVEVTDDSIWYNYPEEFIDVVDGVDLFFDLDNSGSKDFTKSDPNEPDKCTKGLQLTAVCVADPEGYEADNQTSPLDSTGAYSPETWWKAVGTWPLSESSGSYFVEFEVDLADTGMQAGHGYGFDIGINDSDEQYRRNGYLGYKGANHLDESLLASIVLMPKAGCGSYGFMKEDLNKDCVVDHLDLMMLADNWLDCTDVDGDVCQEVFSCFANPEMCN